MTLEDIQITRAFIIMGVMAIVYFGWAILDRIKK